jgi:hypothetical protein
MTKQVRGLARLRIPCMQKIHHKVRHVSFVLRIVKLTAVNPWRLLLFEIMTEIYQLVVYRIFAGTLFFCFAP